MLLLAVFLSKILIDLVVTLRLFFFLLEFVMSVILILLDLVNQMSLENLLFDQGMVAMSLDSFMKRFIFGINWKCGAQMVER